MMRLVSEEITTYCENHSTLPSKAAQDLEAYTHDQVKMSVMLSGPLVGSFLRFMVQATRAKRILEIGCYTGYSALCMAEALPEDGELITLDINPDTDAIANRFWRQSAHGKKIKSIVAPALESLINLVGPFDLVFIDADKTNYINYLPLALERLTPNGVIVADNCLYSGLVVEADPKDDSAKAIKAFNALIHQNPNLESVLLPVRDGLMLIRKK